MGRHPNHDYSAGGGYFITFVAKDREPILGKVTGSRFTQSELGQIVLDCWQWLPEMFPNIVLDAIQVMPDHVHSILLLTDPNHIDWPGGKVKGLGDVMQIFKSRTGRLINIHRSTKGKSVWQSGYVDRVSRNEVELDKFRDYIVTNPLRYSLKHGDHGSPLPGD